MRIVVVVGSLLLTIYLWAVLLLIWNCRQIDKLKDPQPWWFRWHPFELFYQWERKRRMR